MVIDRCNAPGLSAANDPQRSSNLSTEFMLDQVGPYVGRQEHGHLYDPLAQCNECLEGRGTQLASTEESKNDQTESSNYLPRPRGAPHRPKRVGVEELEGLNQRINVPRAWSYSIYGMGSGAQPPIGLLPRISSTGTYNTRLHEHWFHTGS